MGNTGYSRSQAECDIDHALIFMHVREEMRRIPVRERWYIVGLAGVT
jgi:hypothetical protein